MHNQLTTFKSNVETINQGVLDLQSAVSSLNTGVGRAKFVAGQLKKLDKTFDVVDDGLGHLGTALKVLALVKPLKLPAKALEKVLKAVQKPVEKIDDKFDELDKKDDKFTVDALEGKGEFLEKVEENLGKVGNALSAVDIELQAMDFDLTRASTAVGNFLPALQTGLITDQGWGDRYVALNTAVELQVQGSNIAYADLKAFYDSVQSKVDDFLELFDIIDFDGIFAEFVDMDAIASIMAFLKKPLDVASAIIEPIQPLLNAIDALIGLIVNPIIDFLTETLKVDALMDKVSDQIEALLPSIDVLDALEELAQDLLDDLREFALDTMGIGELLGDIEDVFFGGFTGIAEQGPTGWGSFLPEILNGDDGADVLDALGGRDIIRAGGGDDIIIGGEGSDLIDGGAGNDMFFYDASFDEYELGRIEGSDSFTVSHLASRDPEYNSGVDTLLNLDDEDYLVFRDISFSGAELKSAEFGSSILNGTNGDDLLFLDSDGDTVGGFHVANGLAGDDKIFGSTQADQLNGGTGDDLLWSGLGNDQLNGGSGNDTFVPGLGDDRVNGGDGFDTFQVLEGRDTSLRIDLVDGRSVGEGTDALSSVENVIASPHRDHQVLGNNSANSIFTGDGTDVISGLAGDDLIDTGGEDDFIVGGQGSDIIKAGSHRDAMISGSVAVAGVSDFYLGGDGYDLVSYTSSSNTVKFDFNDIGDNPSILQKLKDYMEDLPESERVEIDGTTGEIKRFDAAGNYVTTDYTEEVEVFMGSDKDDLLTGGAIADKLHGAGGDDIIYTGGTENIDGGDGEDTIFAQDVEDGATALQVDGGGGRDTLDLREIDDARWFYKIETAIALQLKAYKTSVEGDNLQNAFNSFFSIKPYNIQEILFGNHNDHIVFNPGGGQLVEFFLLDGDDRFDQFRGNSDIHAGDGDDRAIIGGDAIFRGGNGNDYVEFDDTGRDNMALMGADRDFVMIERFFGHADGGTEYDTIAFDISFNSRIVADLELGTLESFKGVTTNNADQVDMTLENFEELIATDFNDAITGSFRDEQIAGRGGADTIRGAGGRDKLYGGTGNDLIEGGNGDDLLHGGAGNDVLNGGSGRDTASYAWVAPEAEDGDLAASVFGGVNASLTSGVSTGLFGSDQLISIENIFGSNGDDILNGSEFKNVLSGEDGDDQLYGLGGDDVLVTGKGNDVAIGGDGDDTVVVGIGLKSLAGGSGYDTLDFGTVSGAVNIDFNTGSYNATFVDKSPLWLLLDTNDDGIDDSDGTEARLFDGVFITPLQAWEADPQNSNSQDDVNRVLPDEDDEEFEQFLLREVDVNVGSSGSFSGFEAVVGGTSGANIVLTGGVDRFDGRNSVRDIIDLSNSAQAITYNFQTGANNVTVLVGDQVTGIEGMSTGLGDDTLTGDAADNILRGGFGRDFIKGSSGEDELSGNQDDDVVQGGADNDVARGGSGNDDVYGDDGDDSVHGDDGDDRLFGGAGDDYINGGDGMDTASYKFAGGGVEVDLRITARAEVGGGEGRDLLNSIENLEGSNFRDTLNGDDGDNTLWGGAGGDVLWGQEGNDKLRGGDGADSVRGGQGDDDMRGDAGNDYLTGNRGDDVLEGGEGNDTLDGNSGFDTASYVNAASGVFVDLRYSGRDVGGGQGADTFLNIEDLLGSSHADRLTGDAANNVLSGGNGDDIIKGKGGNDTLIGNKGNDRLIGSDGDDLLQGGDDDDILVALAGDDTLQGQSGNDFLYGGRDADYALGGTGDDVVRGNRGEDLLLGGQGSDDLRGGGDSDMLDGGSGNDVLFGDNGADTINGGIGDDVLRGGVSGSEGDGFRDTFVFETGGGFDRIRDFENGLDLLDLSDLGFADFATVQAASEDRSSGLKIDLGVAAEVFIDNMTLAQLTSDDVIL